MAVQIVFLYISVYKYYWREMEKLSKNSFDSVEYQLSSYYRNTYRDIQRNALKCDGDTNYLLLTLVFKQRWGPDGMIFTIRPCWGPLNPLWLFGTPDSQIKLQIILPFYMLYFLVLWLWRARFKSSVVPLQFLVSRVI